MEELHQALLELQELDDEIARAQARFDAYQERFRAVEAPQRTLESEVEALRTKVADFKQQIQKLESGHQNKRERQYAYEQRIERTKSLREEAAARVEIDLIRRAAEADVAEARDVGQELTRTDLRLDELTKQLEKVRAEVAPQRAELQTEADEAEAALGVLQERRTNHAVRIDKPALTLYERVRGRRDRRVLAPMTEEGACGSCFNTLPLQEQTEVRRGETLHRCEACGVILYPQA
ncbi:MAG: zinc ribbon domain-containing protein [Longimicrobiales bacterium]